MKQPNVILVYPDQMRFDALSCNGNTVAHTPNLDTMAAEGASFQEAHSSFPLCCPFRASLMTGLYPHKNGMFSNHYPLATDLPHYLPQIMKDNGYKTGWIGKWHLNGGKKFSRVPREYWFGFEEFVGYSRGHHYIDSVYYRNEDDTPYKSDKYEPEYQTEQLIDFMDRSVAEEKPFLGMICYGLPHHPVDMQPDESKYKFSPDQIELPNTVPEYEREKVKEYIAMYYGMVEIVDREIGRLISHLKEKNLYEDTIFIVVSDHGDMCGEFGMHEKTMFYASATHVPLLITYPKMINKNLQLSQLVDPLVDITPSILDLCGIEVPKTMDGQSLKTMLTTGKDESFRDYVYYQAVRVAPEVCDVIDQDDRKPYGERGFRTKDLVYVEREGIPFALHHSNTDFHEQFNLVDNFRNYFEVKEHRQKLKEIMEELDDSWDIQRDYLPPDFETHANALGNYYDLYNVAKYE